VGKGKMVDVYLEVRKRRGHIFFDIATNENILLYHSVRSLTVLVLN
jgi:hypothetical protein